MHCSMLPHIPIVALLLSVVSVAESRSRAQRKEVECAAGYRERIVEHCRYPDMDQPCFRMSSGADDWSEVVDKAALECCGHGNLCSVEDFEELCCRGLDCLVKCYGDGFLESARSRFRYLDILLNHPHPANRKEDAEGDKDNRSVRKAEELVMRNAEGDEGDAE